MTRTAHLTYAVEPRGFGWAVVFQGVDCSAHASRIDALRSAIRDASFARHLGHNVKVHAKRRTGSYRTIAIPAWDHAGYRPYPPDAEGSPLAGLRLQAEAPRHRPHPRAIDLGPSGPPADLFRWQ